MDHGCGTLPISSRIERLRAARRVRIEPVTNDATIIGFATVLRQSPPFDPSQGDIGETGPTPSATDLTE